MVHLTSGMMGVPSAMCMGRWVLYVGVGDVDDGWKWIFRDIWGYRDRSINPAPPALEACQRVKLLLLNVLMM